MNIRVLLTVFVLPAFSLIFFQGCNKSSFTAIDAVEKRSLLEGHSGLGEDPLDNRNRQTDGGLGSGSPQTDGGLGGGFPQTDGGLGGSPQTDGGMGGSPQTDGGLAGSPQIDGGMPGYGVMGPGMGGLPQTDGGLSGMPNTDGGMNGRPNTDGGKMGGPNTDGGKNGRPNTDGGKMVGPNKDGGTNGMPGFDPGEDPITNPKTGTFNVIRWCRGRDKGATLKEASDINIQLVNVISGELVCEATGKALLDQILNSGQVKLPNCDFSGVSNEALVVKVTDQNGESLSDGTENGDNGNSFSDQRITSDDGRKKFEAVALHMLYERNTDRSNQEEKCDAYNASPLVVDMRTDRELGVPFTLSDPVDGILFDILGENSYPSANTPKQISWMTDPRVMPIVLPRNNLVESVDQMFGDNTLGPDGDFADNGFAALAKYDALNLRTGEVDKEAIDGYITRDDDIYRKLRLWYDRNLDGEIQKRELYSLRRAKVEIIDLNYDPNYYSRDEYGNEIKYKSVVKLRNGKLKPVFDIWFVINNMIQKD